MASALAQIFDGTAETSPLAGVLLGTIERTYGLLRSEESVTIVEALTRTGDLAVADRMAYVSATRTHAQYVVVELDRWYYVCAVDRHLGFDQAMTMHAVDGAPRLLSLVDERGIAPLVSPLVMPAPAAAAAV